jgi:hypothetical protein
MAIHKDCFNIPLVANIIKTKWNRVGKPLLFAEAVLSIVSTILITFILVLGFYSPSLENESEDQLLTTWLYGVTSFVLMYRFIFELPLLYAMAVYNMRHGTILGGLRGAPIVDKICIHISSFAFLVLVYARANTPSRFVDSDNYDLYYEQISQYSLVLCVLFSWFHLYYYLMVLFPIIIRI